MASILPGRKKIMGSQVREKWGGKDRDAPPCGRTRVGMENKTKQPLLPSINCSHLFH